MRQVIRQIALVASLLGLCAVLAGCVHADGPYNQPSQAKLRIESQTPQACAVQVDHKPEVSVGADGRVIVEVPRLHRGYSTYLFGIARVSTTCAEDIPIIVVKRNGRAVRSLSLNDLRKLPVDNAGYSVLKVE